MSRYSKNIKPFVSHELQLASSFESIDPDRAFNHLERAHLLGQASTVQHVRTHIALLRWAVRQHDRHEMIGQFTRIIGAATKTPIGLCHRQTGGAISPFRRLPVPDDLGALIASARS